MSIRNVNIIDTAYQRGNTARGTAAGQAGFLRQLNSTAESEASARLEEYADSLRKRLGANVIVEDVGNDQKSVDRMGAGTSGYNNVVIAPNILERMAGDPGTAAYYEGKIKQGLDRFPVVQAELSAAGFEVYSYGVHIDSHGTVYTYVCGDLKPEVRARIEARIRAEQAAKRARREMFNQRHQEAADERQAVLETQNQKRAEAEAALQKALGGETACHFVTPSPEVSSVTESYESGAVYRMTVLPRERSGL